MTKRQVRRLIATVLLVLTLIITIERIYNRREEFNVSAEDAAYYGIIEANLTTREKLKDFDYMYRVLEENYPFFKVNERMHGIDWLANRRKYRRLIKNTKNDAEFYVAMDRILKDLNNGHVNIFNGHHYRYFYKNYYLRFHNYPEYLAWYEAFSNPYVKNRYDFDGEIEDIVLSQESVLESKILTEEVAYMKISQMASFDTLKNDYVKIKEFLKDVENYPKLIIDIRGNGGGNVGYWQNIVELLIDEPLSAQYYSFFKGGHRHGLDPYKVAYLTTINNLDEEVLDRFPPEVKTDFRFYKLYSTRINPWSLSNNPLDRVNFKGKVYLLVDRGVFSASESFAAFAKDSGFATLVGEPTGGDRVSAEIPIIFLPTSKFAIRYSREMAMNADGSINMEMKTIPHLHVDPEIHEDFKQDKCIQAVIKDDGRN